MSTRDKIRAAVHIVVTMKIILMYQNNNSTIVLHVMFYTYLHNCTLTIFMLIFRVPNRCISTSVLEGTV